jgi:putative membrane protein
MKLIWHWLFLSAVVYALEYFFPGQIAIDKFYIVLVVGACLMFIRMIIDPILNLLALPMNLFTLGLFSVFVNGVIFWSIPYVIAGFHIADFKTAIIGSIIVSIADWLLSKIMR